MQFSMIKQCPVILLLCLGLLGAQVDVYDSGGPLSAEQAAYDIEFYRLDIDFDLAAPSLHVRIPVKPFDNRTFRGAGLIDRIAGIIRGKLDNVIRELPANTFKQTSGNIGAGHGFRHEFII